MCEIGHLSLLLQQLKFQQFEFSRAGRELTISTSSDGSLLIHQKVAGSESKESYVLVCKQNRLTFLFVS